MGDIRHRIGLGTVGSPGSSLSGKNNISTGGDVSLSPPFTFDSTVIKFDSTIRTFDETI